MIGFIHGQRSQEMYGIEKGDVLQKRPKLESNQGHRIRTSAHMAHALPSNPVKKNHMVNVRK